MKAIALLVTVGFAAQVHAAEPPASDYGSRADANTPGRVVKLDAGTRNVNVHDGETVHFILDDRRIDWNFNTRTREAVLDLKTLAPEGMDVGNVRIWVLANPIYQG
ncbi:CzcE family metal-binding protein [Massilia sp. HP4]|uniref:CzcE family metal-binding protein n=1 Tax=Massilia sp. HP4 TaxID=2562316 RepID=UPI0010C11788|nr:CzcE family metal-binding protein [Massilia sp. HP4]